MTLSHFKAFMLATLSVGMASFYNCQHSLLPMSERSDSYEVALSF